MKYFLLEHSMDMLNSINQEPSQSYGILNEVVKRYVGRAINIVRVFSCIITIDYFTVRNRCASDRLIG